MNDETNGFFEVVRSKARNAKEAVVSFFSRNDVDAIEVDVNVLRKILSR